MAGEQQDTYRNHRSSHLNNRNNIEVGDEQRQVILVDDLLKLKRKNLQHQQQLCLRRPRLLLHIMIVMMIMTTRVPLTLTRKCRRRLQRRRATGTMSLRKIRREKMKIMRYNTYARKHERTRPYINKKPTPNNNNKKPTRVTSP